MNKKELDRIIQELETSGIAQKLEITQKMQTLQGYNNTGAKYLDQNNYYSAIAEFSKVAANLHEALDLATNNKSYPPEIISLYLEIVNQALLGRQVAYLSIGDKEKAHADEEMFNTINTLISGINASEHMKSTLERIKAENKKEEGSSLAGCLTIIVIIVVIFMLFK